MENIKENGWTAEDDIRMRKENHDTIKASSNTKILRKQLELLAEYPRVPEGKSQIPECSREMVQIYRELVHAKYRTIFLAVVLFGAVLSLLYGVSIKGVKLFKGQ